MFRHAIIFGALASTALLFSACGDEHYRYSGSRASSRTASTCAEATSCGECTPLLGCGWCGNSDGSGTCTTSPNHCEGQTFSWTWEPTGCRATVDAGAITIGTTPDDDAGIEAEDASVESDAGIDAEAPDAN